MKFTAAAIQMLASDDKAANLAEAARWIRQSAAGCAKLVALPEVFIWRGDKRSERAAAEPIPGPASTSMAVLARELGIYLLAGSILEEIPGSAKAFNTSLLFDPSGKLIATYRKIHLFDVELANKVSARESDTRAAGDTVVIAETDLCKMGLSVCYDLRFAELYRQLAHRQADLIFVPSAFTAYTGQAHWEPLLRARAIENQAYVVAPAQGGTHAGGRRTYGHSMIVGPWGEVLACREEGEGVVLADIDAERVTEVRRRLG
jgi:deaminated glutathione amidase